MDTKRSENIRERFRLRQPAAVRSTVRYSQVVAGTPDEVFPLLCPAREADWLADWDAELIYSESELAEDGCVFRTEEDGRTGDGWWVFTHHERPVRVKIARFSPPVLVLIDIALEPEGEDRTRILWEYRFTGLSTEGNEKVRDVEQVMEGRLRLTTQSLDHYVRTGDLLRV